MALLVLAVGSAFALLNKDANVMTTTLYSTLGILGVKQISNNLNKKQDEIKNVQ